MLWFLPKKTLSKNFIFFVVVAKFKYKNILKSFSENFRKLTTKKDKNFVFLLYFLYLKNIHVR